MLSRSSLYTLVAVAFLVVLFAAVAQGSNEPAKVTAQALDASSILGMMDKTQETTTSPSFVDRLLHSGTENAKGVAAQKVGEVKAAVVETVKREVTRLTDAQVKQLQTQLCSDWGVIPPSPTP